MTFFVSRRERLETSTVTVAGFKSVACRRLELDVSAVPNPAAGTAALFGSFNQTYPTDKSMSDPIVRTTLEVAAEHNKPKYHRPPTPFSFRTPDRSPFDFQPLRCNFTFPLKSWLYKSWRREYHVDASQRDPRFVLLQLRQASLQRCTRTCILTLAQYSQ
jgi:hypothetical protein